MTALGFGVGVDWRRIPTALVDACERLDLPLFRVPYATPFIAIAQTAVQLLGAQARARDSWALEAQRAVANAAAQRDGLAGVVREAASRLGRWIAVADRTGRIIEAAPRGAREAAGDEAIRREVRRLVERGTRASRVSGVGGGVGSGSSGSSGQSNGEGSTEVTGEVTGEAASGAPGGAPRDTVTGGTARPATDEAVEMQTLGRSGRLLGALITPAGVQDHAERTLLGLVAALVTVQLEHRAGQGEAETSLRSAVLRLLLAGETELAEGVATGVLPRLPRGRISVVRLEDVDTLGQGLIDDLRSLATRPGLLTAPLGVGLEPGVEAGAGAVLICEASQADAVRRTLTEHRTPAGVSERGLLGDLGSLLEQAEIALARARSTGTDGPVTYRPALHGGMLRLLDSPEARKQAESLLAPVRQHDRRNDDTVERALAVWLAHHGQTSPAAVELGVHRHTLRSRVQTAATLLQRDLDDPDTRAELWAALRVLGATA
ncbi:helix-turn-helix domain-containing protein [Leucobacter soli]|uniref:helix-turn-helix domain-containing protein n=1 Tax=Leucobacter soli TaxID=2812850 RepID=UPI0036078F7C